ncbi:uncharacterized protein LOC123365071 [Mauremys mutica]|uniref:uncharacterized protein LOC123365071 n=1 Tax=Mauremys mutica TaxID=74926 RepID=UPI001D16E64A|nr:uncharacterized protein LOC123365071 [Mauremys mutica]
MSDSSHEGPLTQPLMDTLEPKTQTLVRHTDECDGLSLSAPLEVEGERSSGESSEDKVNGKDIAQLDDAFLEDPEALDSIASSSEDEPGSPCFCSMPVQIVEEDSKDDGYEEFRRLGMELTEPRPRRELPVSPNYKVSSCEFIDAETVCVSWKHAKDRYSVSGNTNVFIACFTTAYARLELYNLLERLQEWFLYHDTDLVIFVKREDSKEDWRTERDYDITGIKETEQL